MPNEMCDGMGEFLKGLASALKQSVEKEERELPSIVLKFKNPQDEDIVYENPNHVILFVSNTDNEGQEIGLTCNMVADGDFIRMIAFQLLKMVLDRTSSR